MYYSHPASATRHGVQAVCSMLDNSLCKMHYDLGADRAPWSMAHFSGISFDGVDIYDDQGIGGRKVLRSREDIVADPVDHYLLAMPRTARATLAQNGKVNNCAPGNAILFSTALPFSSAIVAERPDGQYAQMLGRISGVMLRQRFPQVDLLSNFVFSTDAGAGKIVKSMFELAVSEGATLSASQQRMFSSMLIDAIVNVLVDVPAPGYAESPVRPSSYIRLRQKAKDFIDRNISNPVLNVGLVAQHCAVSERHLHAAFADVSVRPGALIRETRLQLCRNALMNPVLREKSITEIAMQWGYEDPAHFSRAYKARFRKMPKEDRQSFNN